MKNFCLSVIFVLFAIDSCFAQETRAFNADEEKLEGFAWLRQLEGTWLTTSRAVVSTNPSDVNRGVTISRLIGNVWLVNESKIRMGDMDYESLQTIGYDAKKKHYTSSWVDSFVNHRWLYSGKLDDSGKILTFETEGPDFSNTGKSKWYRDIYELKSADEIVTTAQMKNSSGEWETFMTGSMKRPQASTKLTPFLMFTGQAEQAIDHYKSVFDDTEIVSMKKYGAGAAGKQGTIYLAEIEIAGQRIKIVDSPAEHEFEFTPSFSFFVDCENESQINKRFEILSVGGKILMPIDNYGFSKRFGWVSDKYGVSWQLNLE